MQTVLSRTGVFYIGGRHRTEGAHAARDANQRPKAGDGRPLNALHKATVRKLIADRTLDQFMLPYALWTHAAEAQLIEQRCGMRVRTMGLRPARRGFTPQEQLKNAYDQLPAAVKNWFADRRAGRRIARIVASDMERHHAR